MLVVKKPFKSIGKVYTVGSVITDPTAIKRLKGKIAEGKIIEVTEHTYDSTSKYFKAKYNVDLPAIKQNEETDVEETDVEEKVTVTSKAIAKASAVAKK